MEGYILHQWHCRRPSCHYVCCIVRLSTLNL